MLLLHTQLNSYLPEARQSVHAKVQYSAETLHHMLELVDLPIHQSMTRAAQVSQLVLLPINGSQDIPSMQVLVDDVLAVQLGQAGCYLLAEHHNLPDAEPVRTHAYLVSRSGVSSHLSSGQA